jgi:hypothetical protein
MLFIYSGRAFPTGPRPALARLYPISSRGKPQITPIPQIITIKDFSVEGRKNSCGTKM